MPKHVAPSLTELVFTCPHCETLTGQRWQAAGWYGHATPVTGEDVMRATCVSCKGETYWVKDRLVEPAVTGAPPPAEDMSKAVKVLYLEAAAVAVVSPRAAAALLRTAVEVLCKELGAFRKPSDRLDDAIANLVDEGLPVEVQRALDIVRVIGNGALHPGQIDENDNDPDLAVELCRLVNFIVEDRITRPLRIGSLYEALPEGKRVGIEQRDGRTGSAEAPPPRPPS